MTERNIKLAKYAGFCYGVKRAVETVKKLKTDNPQKEVFILGELIHNSDVIKELSDLGIKTIDKLPEKGEGICVIRSHGASPEVFRDAEKAGFEVYDLTCPDVKKVQQKAIQLVNDGYFLIIVGKSEHPEVVAIYANAKMISENVVVANSPEQLEPYKEVIASHKKIGVVVQTTQRPETLNSVVTYLLPLGKELFIANTICPSTSMRQKEVKSLATDSDLVVVVGSKKSANTTHLAEIVKDISKTIHIENDKDLLDYSEIINKSQSISVTAGASTPESVIETVVSKIKGGI